MVSKTYSLMKHWRASAQKKRNSPSSAGVAGPSARGIEQDRADAGETALELDVADRHGFEHHSQQLIVGDRGKAAGQILEREPRRPRARLRARSSP